MGNEEGKSQKPLKGVCCDAVNCEYNTGNGECRATQISVGPMCAISCTDTVCATFRPKEEARGLSAF